MPLGCANLPAVIRLLHYHSIALTRTDQKGFLYPKTTHTQGASLWSLQRVLDFLQVLPFIGDVTLENHVLEALFLVELPSRLQASQISALP